MEKQTQDILEDMGQKAFTKGITLRECPFRFGTNSRVYWKKGWLAEWAKVNPGKEYEDCAF